MTPASSNFEFRKPWFGKARYFISHAYDDAAALDQLVADLPPHVAAFIFPAISVTPEQRVSDDIVREVRRSKGLVHLAGGASASSFWVAFERRTALVAHLPVVVYDPAARAFSTSELRATAPACSFVWNEAVAADDKLAKDVSRWLVTQRAIDVTAVLPRTGLPSTHNDIRDRPEDFRAKQQAGGTIVLFLSHAALASEGFESFREGPVRDALTDADVLRRRTLIAWTETPYAARIDATLKERWGAPHYAALRQAVLESISEHDRKLPIILAPGGRIDWRRVDDLLVRTEYLAFKIGGSGRMFTEDMLTIFDEMQGRPVSDRPGIW